jgi:hypothetical protein
MKGKHIDLVLYREFLGFWCTEIRIRKGIQIDKVKVFPVRLPYQLSLRRLYVAFFTIRQPNGRAHTLDWAPGEIHWYCSFSEQNRHLECKISEFPDMRQPSTFPVNPSLISRDNV